MAVDNTPTCTSDVTSNVPALTPVGGLELLQQPDEEVAFDSGGGGALDWQISWRGGYEELINIAKALSSADWVSRTSGLNAGVKWYVVRAVVRRGSGDRGMLTLTLARRESDAQTGGTCLKETWHVKSCRNEYAANRAWIECWQRESDAAVAKLFNYTRPDGTVAKLEDQLFHTATEDVIRKLMEGKESVMRFYPLLQRRRKYTAAPGNLMDALATVDAPPTPGANATKPVGLGAFVAKYEWLKCQDDIDEDEEHYWHRVESWMGILKTAASDGHPWDPNFYSATVDDSTNGWKFPHGASQN